MQSHTGFTQFYYMCDCGFVKCSRDKRARSIIARLHAKTCFVAASALEENKDTRVIFKPTLFQGQNGEKEARAFLEEQNCVHEIGAAR